MLNKNKNIKVIMSFILAFGILFTILPSVFSSDMKENIEWAIEPIYEQAMPFSKGIASVRMNGKWGAIDKTGKIIVPTIYDTILYFREGIACVQKDGKWGFIDETNKEVIPFIYDNCGSFSEGLALVGKGKYPNTKYGFINRAGEEVIPFIYDEAGDFHDGLAVVNIGGYGSDGKWGYIDTAGKEVIPLQYDFALDFSEGMAAVNKDGKCGYIDKTGEELIPFIYDPSFSSFSEGLTTVEKDSNVIIIDTTGNEILHLKYDWVWGFSEGLAAFRKDGKIGFVDKTGIEIVPPIYDEVDFLDNTLFHEGLAPVHKTENQNMKGGFVDKAGNLVVPLIFDSVEEFSEGLAPVKKDGKWGYIRNIYTRINVTLNGTYLDFDQPPVIIDNRTLVPIRAVCEKLGADVYWIDEAKIVVIVKNDMKLFFKIGEKDMHIIKVVDFSEFEKKYNKQDEGILLDVPSQIIGDRTLLPIRTVCEALGANVDWDEDNSTVVITCPQELINDINRDTTFFGEMMAYMKNYVVEHTDPQKAAYKDFDYAATITIELSDSVQLVSVREFIETNLNSEGVARYTFDFPKKNSISVTFGFYEGYDIDGFSERLTNEIAEKFADVINTSCGQDKKLVNLDKCEKQLEEL